tara:strand:- start:2105 stop:2644 length:540 start_codon:yes stop_codon:yes gene_type:complete
VVVSVAVNLNCAVFVLSVIVNEGEVASLKSISPLKVGLVKVLFVRVCVPVRVVTVESIAISFELASIPVPPTTFKVTPPDEPPPVNPFPAVTEVIFPVSLLDILLANEELTSINEPDISVAICALPLRTLSPVVLNTVLSTAKLLFELISPPPDSPSPAVKVIDVWSMCSFDTKPDVES